MTNTKKTKITFWTDPLFFLAILKSHVCTVLQTWILNLFEVHIFNRSEDVDIQRLQIQKSYVTLASPLSKKVE